MVKRRPGRSRRGAVSIGRLAAAALAAALAAVQWLDPPPVENVRVRVFDLYQQLRPRAGVDTGRVAVAYIDEASLARYGQWPWPRTVVAQLVAALGHAGAAAIGFDVVFAEGDRTSPEFASRFMAGLDDATFEKLNALPHNDSVLAAQIAAAPVVLGQSAAVETTGPARAPTPTAVNRIGDVVAHLPRYPALLRNLAELETAARGIGVFSLLPENDGVVRRIPSAVAVGGRVLPALSMELLRVAAGAPSIDIRAGTGGIEALRVGPLIVPTDGLGRIRIRYSRRGAWGSHSVGDILAGDVPVAELRGRIVLVGASALALHDMRATPLDSFVPGVEIHAQALDMVLDGVALERPDWTRAAELAVTLLAAFASILLAPRAGALAALAVGSGVAVAAWGASWFLFARGILFDATAPVAATALVLALLVVQSYLREQTERRRIRSAFSQYVPPDVVSRLEDDPEPVRLGGETREMSILFCDIRGFTAIAESHQREPERLTMLVNDLLTPLSAAVHDRGGTIDKYIGDCVMAFWNAPVEDPSHRRNACLAALGMVDAAARADVGASVRVGVGVNTGTVVVGNMGSDVRFDYTVLGDAVNLAARLEGQSKEYGVDIVVSAETAAGLHEELAFLELDLVAVVGKSEPTRIYALLGPRGPGSDWAWLRLRNGNAAMLADYRGRDWDAALSRIGELRALSGAPAAYYALMAGRIARYRDEPPPADWAGVHVAAVK